VQHARTVWEEGREPGSRVVALFAALCLTEVVLELLAHGRLGIVFDLAFVAAAVLAALLVAPRDFFTIGVLPPLAMITLFLLLALVRRDAIADPGDGAVQAVVTGLGRHSVALFVGYALSLLALQQRRRVLRDARLSRRTPTRPPHPVG
jgi:hypothetical protein